jgi:hypothetical protein
MANPTLDEAEKSAVKAIKALLEALSTQALIDVSEMVTKVIRRETTEG